jgi:hypothetical protein
MLRRTLLYAVLLLPELLLARPDWQFFDTPHFRILYPRSYDWEARQACAGLEGYYPNATTLAGNRPARVPIVIEDLGTLSNGSADPVFNNIHLLTYPPDAASGIGFGQNWWRMVGVHEYIHMAHLTSTSGLPAVLTAVFGSILHPNLLSPGWITEGITVFGESQLSPYEGRLNDGFYDAVVAARAKENRLPSIMDATCSPLEHPPDGIYLFGGTFFNYLARRHGREKFAGLLRSNGAQVTSYCTPCTPCLGIDVSVAGQYPARNFPSLFSAWRKYETERSRNWKIDGERLTRQGWNAGYLAPAANGIYYYRERTVKTGPFTSFSFADINALELLSSSASTRRASPERTALRVNSRLTCPFKLGDRPGSMTLYYAAADYQPGAANISYLGLGVVSNLHARDLSTGQDRILLRDRLRCFAVLPDGRIIYARDRAHAFGSDLLVFTPQSTVPNPHLLLSSDLLIGEIAADPDYVVVSARSDWENWNIYELDLDSLRFTRLMPSPWMQSGLNICGERLLFATNYQGRYVARSYDFRRQTCAHLTQGGFATWPVHSPRDSLLYFVGLNASGQDIYRQTADFSAVFIPQESVPPQRPVLPGSGQYVSRSSYASTLASLVPAIHIPYILPADTSLRNWDAGVLLMGQNATTEHTYQLSLNERFRYDSTARFALPGVVLDYQGLFLAPAELDLSLVTSTPFASVSARYPFSLRLDCPLRRLFGSLEADFFERGFRRKALLPSMTAGFSWPGTRLGVIVSGLYEHHRLGSSRDQALGDLSLVLRQYVANSELDLSGEAFFGTAPTAITMTGYPDAVSSRAGFKARLEYSMPLLKLRWGLWSPNIYFEDVCGSVFTECDHALRTFTGVRLQLETQVALGFFQLVPWVGVGITRTGVPRLIGSVELASTLVALQTPPSRVIADITGRDRGRPLMFLTRPR